MTTITLTEDQLNTAAFALGVAAERYERNAQDLRRGARGDDAATLPVNERLAQQFDKQAKDARALAELIQEA